MLYQLRRRAYHESGHAVAAKVFGIGIKKLDLHERPTETESLVFGGEIVTEFGFLPFMFRYLTCRATSSFLVDYLNRARMCLGGYCSERMFARRESDRNGSYPDMLHALRFIREASESRPIWMIGRKIPTLEDLALEVKSNLSTPENKKKLRRIARALVRKCRTTGELSGEEIEKILAEC